jgi:2-polyprenyl-6-methoxyphenol hydroxylase-like FAD-dependent oxidoreductase
VSADLQGYTRERRPIGTKWIRFSEAALRIVQSANPFVVHLRNFAIGVASRFPSIQRQLLKRVSGLAE